MTQVGNQQSDSVKQENGGNVEIHMVSIPLKEYLELKDRDFKLQCLEAGGVDNWEVSVNH